MMTSYTQVRLNKHEKEELQIIAKTYRLNMSDYIRFKIGFDMIKKGRPLQASRDILKGEFIKKDDLIK